ncbi:unnamed protein product [Trichobilharzia szidati]|nr:unnamed protein product [Trichobilharzia szidati]
MNPFQNMALSSEGELVMDFEADFSSSGSESSSLYNSDSGVSVTTPPSCSTWSAWDPEHPDDTEDIYFDLTPFYQAHSFTVIQAIHCLSDKDIDIVLNASTYLFHLCKNGYAPFISQICPDILLNIKIPVFCPSSSKYVDVIHCMSGIINYFSQCPEGINMILHRGGLDIINGLLLFPFESVLYFCVTALHNVLLSHESAKSFIHRTCISNRLINLLNYSVEHSGLDMSSLRKSSINSEKSINPKFSAVLCDCLYILAYGHESTKRSFKEQGGLSSLLTLITVSTYEKVLWTATRLLRVLSAWIPVKCEIIAQDPFLCFFSHCLGCQSSRVVANVLWTMRNLSDIAVDKITSDVSVNIVRQLLSLLKSSTYGDSCVKHYSFNNRDDCSVFRCILGTLANLTCRNNAAKCYVVRHNGIDLILQILYAEIRGQKNYYHTMCETLSQALLNMSIQCKTDGDGVVTAASSSTASLTTKTSSIPTTPTSEINNSHHNNNSCHKLLISPLDSIFTMKKHYSLKQNSELYHLHDNKLNNSNNNNNLLNTTPILNATLDLIEAGIRCLSHLTVGHSELFNVFNYFIHQRFASKLIISMGSIYLPSLLSFPFDQHIDLCRKEETTTSNTTTNNNNNSSSNNNTWEFDCLTQILQLTKTWSILVRNICVNTSLSSSTSSSLRINRNAEVVSNDGINSNLCWPKHLRSQLRHGVHKLVQNLRHLMNSLPRDCQPKELKTTMDIVHNLSITLSNSNGNNHNNNSNNNNIYTT